MELNGKKVIVIEVGGVNTDDYPDFGDAFFSYAEYEDGTELTDSELDQLAILYPDVVHSEAHSGFFNNA